ncbi:MAG TPA: PRTRC system ThiF family protein [bacterium]|nr:PRTRC system ThiF family protein [bacterium]
MNPFHATHEALIRAVHPVSVSLIGCGGTGSQLLTNLARMDAALRALGHQGLQVTVFDPDTITAANVARQSFPASEIGAYKAVSHTQRVNRFFGIRWEAYPEAVSASEPHPAFRSHVYISAVDSVAARIDILNAIRRTQKDHHYRDTPLYWIDCGNTKTTGQVVIASLFTNPRGRRNRHLKNIFELYPDYEKADRADDTPSCSLAEAIGKQDLFINTMMAAYAADLLWKLIRQANIDCQGVFVNLDTLQTRPIPLKQPLYKKRRKR